MLRKLLLLAIVSLLCLPACKKAPKSLQYKGKDFILMVNRRHMMFKFFMYFPKGQNQLNAKESVHVLEFTTNVKLTDAIVKKARGRYIANIKRMDPQFTKDEALERFCYGQRVGPKKLRVHAYLVYRKGVLRIYQYVEELTGKLKTVPTGELCYESLPVFTELSDVADRFR